MVGYYDKCFDDLPIDLERGEVNCIAHSLRKNRTRTVTGGANAQKRPCRLDGSLRAIGDNPLEYGGIECARSFNGGQTSNKWITTSFKVSRALRDMLFRLHQHVNHDPTVVPKVQLVGIFTAGLTYRLSRMYSAKGYVCLLHHENTLQVPKTISASGIRHLSGLLLHVLMMKEIVKASIEAVDTSLNGGGEQLLDDLLAVIDRQEDGGLGWAVDTP